MPSLTQTQPSPHSSAFFSPSKFMKQDSSPITPVFKKPILTPPFQTPIRKSANTKSSPAQNPSPKASSFPNSPFIKQKPVSKLIKESNTENDLAQALSQMTLNHATPQQIQKVSEKLKKKSPKSPSYSPFYKTTPMKQNSVTKPKRISNQSTSFSSIHSPFWKKGPSKKQHADRFIGSHKEYLSYTTTSHSYLEDTEPTQTVSSLSSFPTTTEEHLDLTYQYQVAKACGLALDQKILNFSAKSTGKSKLKRPVKQQTLSARRKIPTVPERILDAPGMLNDFYLNLLDWSSKNVLAVSLGSMVYLWDGASGETQELFEMEDDSPVVSLTWSPEGNCLAVGDSFGNTHILDIEKQQKVRLLEPEKDIGFGSAMHWNRQLLCQGTSQGFLFHHDVRVLRHKVKEIQQAHQDHICGLKWSPDQIQLATGGNDHYVNIWDVRYDAALFKKKEHKAAVKAIGWSPWQSHLLGTGGGLDDHSVCFWNTATGQLTKKIDTGSQVTQLFFSKTYREFVTAHGYDSNSLNVWKYQTLQKVMEIPNAHDARILHMTMSPDGQTVTTGSADENLKFWKLFAFDAKSVKVKHSGSSSDPQKKETSPDFGGVQLR